MDTNTILKSVNMRNTPGRRAVLEYLTLATSPSSIDEIEKSPIIKKLQLDQATIYRIINVFTQRGILHAVNFQEGKTRYELTSHPHHHHVVCTSCGKVNDVEDCLKPQATTLIQKETGFLITSHALEFFGLCPACQH
jgi:Fe2+ or Zn2+ uptake regulation protein